MSSVKNPLGRLAGWNIQSYQACADRCARTVYLRICEAESGVGRVLSGGRAVRCVMERFLFPNEAVSCAIRMFSNDMAGFVPARSGSRRDLSMRVHECSPSSGLFLICAFCMQSGHVFWKFPGENTYHRKNPRSVVLSSDTR